MLALAGFGLILAKDYHDGFTNPVLYGLVMAGSNSWRTRFVLPKAGLFFVLGLWLLLKVDAPGAGLVRALIGRWRDPGRGGIAPAHGLLLVPVTAMTLLLLGPRYWFGMPLVEVTGSSCSTRSSPRPAWSWCSAPGPGPRPWPRRACWCSAATGC